MEENNTISNPLRGGLDGIIVKCEDIIKNINKLFNVLGYENN